ncbi:ankyrin repeat domain-containing protein [Endozoicomonas sp. ONNA2]|uniref:ankyrin repeat domain-containing protein n=1 Tax=Endozoicomonas sp. ONNA2 TaxID=2828741 RepID=UPI0021494A89|nr:ankyrin repeat domain-containing protein [Endozoicomonas sp. ONNA2]
MNISTPDRPASPAYHQLTNDEVCDDSTQPGSLSVSLAPTTHRTHSSSIDPSLTGQIPICKRAVETKTESLCQNKSVTNGGVKAHDQTGHIKKATKELHHAIMYTKNLEDLTNDDIRALIDKGADVNAETRLSHKKTALHLAALRGNQRIMELLVNEANADVNAIAESGVTVMECVHQKGSITPLIPFMVNAGFNVNAVCDLSGGTMLVHAAREQKWELVEFLFAKGVNPDDQIDDYGTALHLAVRLAQPEIIDMLMKHGANINASVKYKWRTALHLAAESGQREILDKLLQHNADVNAQDSDGRTPLYYLTCADGQLDTIKYFMNTLIVNKADINHRDKYGITPLHFAAKNGQLDTFSYLLENGADKYARTNSGKMALEIAWTNGQNTAKMLEILDNNGLDVSAPCNSKGGTPIAYAARNRQWKLFDSLILRGAKIDAWENEKDKYTPLHYAALADQKDTVRELVSRHADANSPDIHGDSAIHYAVSYEGYYKENLADRQDILVDLLENGKADINARGYGGRTALHIACREGELEIVAELLERKADFSILDDDKKTAYDRTFDRIKFDWDAPKEKEKIRSLMKENKADVRGADVRKAKAAEEGRAEAAARQRTLSGLTHKVKAFLQYDRKR